MEELPLEIEIITVIERLLAVLIATASDLFKAVLSQQLGALVSLEKSGG